MATTQTLRNGEAVFEEDTATWTGDSSGTVTPSLPFQLHNITIHYDGSITNNATVTIDRLGGANYDTDLETIDQSGGVTDVVLEFDDEDGYKFAGGTGIKVACNVGSDNAYVTVSYTALTTAPTSP